MMKPNDIPADDPVAVPEQKARIDAILEQSKTRPGTTMLVLTRLQEEFGFVSPAMQRYVSEQLNIPLSHIYGVLTFYSFFRMQPQGRYKVNVCLGTACYVRNGPSVVEKLQQVLGVKVGETTPDRKFTLEICRCVGACSQAPVVMINDEVIGRVNPSDVPKMLRKYA